jgi:PRTRC genetic system protein B
MMNYNDITEDFENPYTPFKALVFYRQDGEPEEKPLYVESYDVSKTGNPINAHPLTMGEMGELKRLIVNSQNGYNTFLHADGVLPGNLLYLDTTPDAENVIWFTGAARQRLYFVDSLGIPSGKLAKVPAMLWKATPKGLFVFALKAAGRPSENTRLYHAPFFNLYNTGAVCMGNVQWSFNKTESVQKFITKWQHYFWNSRFSHLLAGNSPVKNNIVQFWQHQIADRSDFPLSVLKPTNLTLKSILS